MKFGYARVSTNLQIMDRQLDALRAYGVDEIYEEKKSGTLQHRSKLDEMLNKLRPGDTVVVYELKRLGRNTKQLLQLIEYFDKLGVDFVSLTEQIDTTTPMGKFVCTTWCALAQLDRDIIAENTRSGLASARARGHTGGRPATNPKVVAIALKMYDSGQFTISEILKQTKISKSTLYHYLHKRKETLYGETK